MVTHTTLPGNIWLAVSGDMQNKWSLFSQRQVPLDTALLGICSLLLLLQKSRLKGEAFAVLYAGFTTTVSWLFRHGFLGKDWQKSFQPIAG